MSGTSNNGERLQAEAAVRESEERLREIFEHSPIPIGISSTPEGRFLAVNDAAARLFGASREEMVGRTPEELQHWVSEEDRARYHAILRRDGQISGFETPMRRKNGGQIIALIFGSIIKIGGKPYVLTNLLDITESKRITAALRESEERYQLVNRATFNVIWDQNLLTGDIWWNEHLQTLFGYAPEEVNSRREFWLSRLHPGDLDRVSAGVKVAMDSDSNLWSDVYRFRRKDGTYAVVEDRAYIIRDATGRQLRMLGAMQDITARQQAEEKFRTIFDNAAEGIYQTTPEGRFLLANPALARILGYDSPEQLMAERTDIGRQGYARPERREEYKRLIAEHGAVTGFEYEGVRKDGRVVWLSETGRAVRDPSGRIVYYEGLLEDITERKLAAERQVKLEEQLRQSQKMEAIGTLAGGIAHDFNNILTGLSGFTELARLDIAPGHPAREWIDNIGSSAQRAKELVQQILAFSRKSEVNHGPVRLQQVIGEALRLLRSSLPAMVQLEHKISPACPMIMGDSTQIHQVIMNMCTNAWHALPESNGVIRLELAPVQVSAEQAASLGELKTGPCVRLTVSDNGCGMEQAVVPRIFEPFYTTKETGKGTGLGLAVVHGIVKSHGGAITVESAPGRGTKFDIYFPAVPVAAGEWQATVTADLPHGRGERLLYVDDELIAGIAVERLLTRLGYRVVRFVDPQEAWSHFQSDPAAFDLVFSDLAMPRMPGHELVAHILRLRPGIPVIMLTGQIDQTRRQSLLDLGVREIILKPPSLEDLAKAAASAKTR